MGGGGGGGGRGGRKVGSSHSEVCRWPYREWKSLSLWTAVGLTCVYPGFHLEMLSRGEATYDRGAMTFGVTQVFSHISRGSGVCSSGNVFICGLL